MEHATCCYNGSSTFVLPPIPRSAKYCRAYLYRQSAHLPLKISKQRKKNVIHSCYLDVMHNARCNTRTPKPRLLSRRPPPKKKTRYQCSSYSRRTTSSHLQNWVQPCHKATNKNLQQQTIPGSRVNSTIYAFFPYCTLHRFISPL